MQAQELADIATIYDKTEVFIFAMMYTNGYRIICILDSRQLITRKAEQHPSSYRFPFVSQEAHQHAASARVLRSIR